MLLDILICYTLFVYTVSYVSLSHMFLSWKSSSSCRERKGCRMHVPRYFIWFIFVLIYVFIYLFIYYYFLYIYEVRGLEIHSLYFLIMPDKNEA